MALVLDDPVFRQQQLLRQQAAQGQPVQKQGFDFGSILGAIPGVGGLKALAKTPFTPKMAVGGLGLAGLAGLVGAAGEFGDTAETPVQNAVDATGRFGGTLGGGALAGAAAGMMGGGPIGALILGSLGAALGGEAGKGLTRAVSDAFFGADPNAQIRKTALLDGRNANQIRAEQAQTMLPIVKAAQEQQLALERQRLMNQAQVQRDLNYQNLTLGTASNQAQMGMAGMLAAQQQLMAM